MTPNTVYADDDAGGTVLGQGDGRYVFGQVSKYRKDQFMLDTETGRLWVVKSSPGEPATYLEPVPYRLSSGELRYTPPRVE